MKKSNRNSERERSDKLEPLEHESLDHLFSLSPLSPPAPGGLGNSDPMMLRVAEFKRKRKRENTKCPIPNKRNEALCSSCKSRRGLLFFCSFVLVDLCCWIGSLLFLYISLSLSLSLYHRHFAMNALSMSTLLTPHSASLKLRNTYQKSPTFSVQAHISSSSSSSSSSSVANFHGSQPRTSPTFELPKLGFDLETSSHPLCPSLNSPQTQEMAMRGAASDVMGLLLKERIVFLGNSIDDFVADATISQLLLLDAQDPTKDIRLFVNSPGGSLSATMAIYDVVQLVRADVSTIALGITASTASIILGGGTKGKRLAMANSRIMLHQPLGGASGQAIDVEIQAREIMHNKNNVTRIISSFTGRTFEQVQKDIDRDRYMSPIEAVEYGIIDGVIDRDGIIPLEPVPERVKSRLNYEEISKDPRKFLTPDIPDDEIY